MVSTPMFTGGGILGDGLAEVDELTDDEGDTDAEGLADEEGDTEGDGEESPPTSWIGMTSPASWVSSVGPH